MEAADKAGLKAFLGSWRLVARLSGAERFASGSRRFARGLRGGCGFLHFPIAFLKWFVVELRQLEPDLVGSDLIATVNCHRYAKQS